MNLAVLLLVLFQAGQATPQAPVSPDEPSGETKPPIVDPAAVTFATPAGALLVTIKPDKTTDYEAAIIALQDALAASSEPGYRALAEGWRVFKATEPDAKGAAIYVHFVNPAVPEADYRPSLLLDALLTDPPGELLAKYRDAFVGAPSKLSLTELAHMAVKPSPPANSTPPAPAPPKPPGR